MGDGAEIGHPEGITFCWIHYVFHFMFILSCTCPNSSNYPPILTKWKFFPVPLGSSGEV